ncbi:hypothetical protein L195_g021554 [Trifolium pratense]|uniref:Uncharacterized protein n=1 Tax=Trifolium pratense TaxID=57577 RepID=A0A2K3N5K3_TRIPR|nr:hypothetical protein L195_g021554 [Trifolium pratense]
MLGLLERNSSIYFNIKALFDKLQNPKTNEETFLLVTQAETYLEQYAKHSQLLTRNDELLNSQLSAQQHYFDQAARYNAEATRVKTASSDAFNQIIVYEDNISKWRSEIKELEEKIRQEEAKKERFTALAVEVPRAKIDELAHEGIQHYSDGLAVQKEVERLANDKEVLQPSRPARTRILRPRKAKGDEVETIVLSSDSSGSDDTNSDYAEFLSTLEPEDPYPGSPSSEKEESQASVNPHFESRKRKLRTRVNPKW